MSEVNNPKHYVSDDPAYEVIKIIKAKLTPEEYRGYVKGNVLKYILRAGKKQGTSEFTDIAKANKYLQWAAEVANMVEAK